MVAPSSSVGDWSMAAMILSTRLKCQPKGSALGASGQRDAQVVDEFLLHRVPLDVVEHYARNESEAVRRLAEEARELRDQHREAFETIRKEGERMREVGETARSAAEAARHVAMELVRATADTLLATLAHMQVVEEMRRTLREIRDAHKLDSN